MTLSSFPRARVSNPWAGHGVLYRQFTYIVWAKDCRLARQTHVRLPLAHRDFHILLALADGPLHGYAIWRALEDQSCAGIRVELGSLYRLLSKLLGAGFIDHALDVDQPTHAGRARRSYRLTPPGLAAMQAETRRLRELVQTAEAAFLPGALGH